jgi:UDP-GlcNAc:undecaprenyl-phosphate GlcNAc-1-phosphate transferase
MKSAILLFLLAAAASAILLPLAILLYRKLGKLDHPDSTRKLHAAPIPRAGGIAIFGAFALALAALNLFPAGGNALIDRYSNFLARLFPATAVIFLTGLFDDWLDLRPRHKLAGQLVASCLAYWAGIRLLPLPADLEWLSFVLTVFWLILSANAFNLIDGSDGLAGSLGALSCAGLIALAIVVDYHALALLFAPLAGAILPFLYRNWPPARVFMGDSGSLTIGFLLGCGGAALSRRFPDGTGLLAAILLLALPLADVAISAARRALRGRSIFEADCYHLHHQLRRQGHDARSLLFHMSLFSALAVAVASSLFVLGAPERILLLGSLAILFLNEIKTLAYAEFRVLSAALFGGGLRLWLKQQIEVEALERDIAAARTPEDVWRILKGAGASLGLNHLYVKLGPRQWHTDFASGAPSAAWQIRLDLPCDSWVNFSVATSLSAQLNRLENPATDFARAVQRSLNAPRLARLLPPAALAPPLDARPSEFLLLDRSA